jgi:hypothetical protein
MVVLVQGSFFDLGIVLAQSLLPWLFYCLFRHCSNLSNSHSGKSMTADLFCWLCYFCYKYHSSDTM